MNTGVGSIRQPLTHSSKRKCGFRRSRVSDYLTAAVLDCQAEPSRGYWLRRRLARRAFAGSTKRLFEGDLKARGKELSGAIGGDDHVVFAAEAEFAGDVDAGLVGKGHARGENGFMRPDKIRMF